MSDTLHLLIRAALARRYGDMLPVLVCCDCAEEEGHDVTAVRVAAELLAHVPRRSSLARWGQDEEINWILRRLQGEAFARLVTAGE